MLTDDQVIDEVRRALAVETAGVSPRPGLLDRVHRELATTPARRFRRAPRRTGAIAPMAAVAVALAVALVALLVLHHGTSRRLAAPASRVAVGTVHLAVRVPDPYGGRPWGLRTVQTRPLRACLQIGRVQSGRIGALGQDGAYGNDGRFHPIVLHTNFPCAQTDAHGYLFHDVFEQEIPSSAAFDSASSCVTDQPPARVRHQLRHYHARPTCHERDLRNVAYGVLGPDAVSITYQDGQHSVTEHTGPDGAYLVVLPATKQFCTTNPGRGTDCQDSSGEITTSTLQSGVITAVQYRDGHVCHLPTPSASGVLAANCPNVGYARYPPAHIPTITPTQVRTTITSNFVIGTRFCYRPQKGINEPIDRRCDHGIPRGYKVGFTQRSIVIHLHFTARLAADNHRSVYEWSLGRATGPKCSGSASVDATTMVPIRAGQHVVLQDNEAPCPGTYKGVITYQPNGGPGRDTLSWDSPIHDDSTLVGRFSFIVR